MKQKYVKLKRRIKRQIQGMSIGIVICLLLLSLNNFTPNNFVIRLFLELIVIVLACIIFVKLELSTLTILEEKCGYCEKSHETGLLYCPFCGMKVKRFTEKTTEYEKNQIHRDLNGMARAQDASANSLFEESLIETVDDRNPTGICDTSDYYETGDFEKYFNA